jgi:Mycobacterium membrane protein
MDGLPPPPTGNAPARTRLPRVVRIILILGAVLVIGLAIIAALPSNRWFWSMLLAKGPHQMTYEVTGSARSASVRYLTADGRVVVGDVPLPWDLSFVADTGARLQLQAVADDDGSVTCRIKWEGHSRNVDAEVGGSPSSCSVPNGG